MFLNIAVGRMEGGIFSAAPSPGERVRPAVKPVGEVAQAWQCTPRTQVWETTGASPRRRGQHLEAAAGSGILNDDNHR